MDLIGLTTISNKSIKRNIEKRAIFVVKKKKDPTAGNAILHIYANVVSQLYDIFSWLKNQNYTFEPIRTKLTKNVEFDMKPPRKIFESFPPLSYT